MFKVLLPTRALAQSKITLLHIITTRKQSSPGGRVRIWTQIFQILNQVRYPLFYRFCVKKKVIFEYVLRHNYFFLQINYLFIYINKIFIALMQKKVYTIYCLRKFFLNIFSMHAVQWSINFFGILVAVHDLVKTCCNLQTKLH